ncbi:MAG: hypothetical protein V3R89_04615 [Thermoanaerobaculia bacterium]
MEPTGVGDHRLCKLPSCEHAPAGCIITGAPVPTTSEVGLSILTLLLALGGLTALFRRRYA